MHLPKRYNNHLFKCSITCIIFLFLKLYDRIKWATQILGSIGLLLFTEKWGWLVGYKLYSNCCTYHLGSCCRAIVSIGQIRDSTSKDSCSFRCINIIHRISTGLDFCYTNNKRICTSSFVLTSGGWALLTLVFSYWFIDVRKINKWIFPFLILGTNSIFTYLFFNTVREQWFNNFIAIFTNGILSWFNTSVFIINLVASVTILGLEWLLCHYLYKQRIFFRI